MKCWGMLGGKVIGGHVCSPLRLLVNGVQSAEGIMNGLRWHKGLKFKEDKNMQVCSAQNCAGLLHIYAKETKYINRLKYINYNVNKIAY